jgi:hypothetical protein
VERNGQKRSARLRRFRFTAAGVSFYFLSRREGAPGHGKAPARPWRHFHKPQ